MVYSESVISGGIQVMFNKAKEKIVNWWKNPYWAPVTEPLKMVASAAYAPNKGFVECIEYAMKDDNKDSPALARIFSAFRNVSYGNMVTFLSSTILAGVAGIAGGLVAGALISYAGMGVLAIGAGAVTAAAAAAIATPFAIMGVIGFAGASLAAVCSPYGMARGCFKAFKHHQQQKTQAAAIQAIPAVKNAAPDVQETATQLYKSLRDMPAEMQAPVLKSLSEKFARTGTGTAQSVINAIDAMPEADRMALVRDLQTKLSTTFETVANSNAEQAITLQKSATTMPTIKLKTHAG
jgi:hypothetical protein